MSKKFKGNATYMGNGDITEPNPYLKQHLIDAVENQLRDNNPPVTRETFERLQADGYTTQQAKEKIAAVLIESIYNVLKTNTPHNDAEYEKRLRALS